MGCATESISCDGNGNVGVDSVTNFIPAILTKIRVGGMEYRHMWAGLGLGKCGLERGLGCIGCGS